MQNTAAAKYPNQNSCSENIIKNALQTAKEISKNSFEDAETSDAVDGFPIETIEKIRKNNLFSSILPEKFGGVGIGLEKNLHLEMLHLHKHFGYGNLVVGRVFEGHFNALLLIKLFGTEKQFQKYAADVTKKSKIFGVWNTEAENGVKFESVGNGKFQINGEKIFATGVDFVERPIITGAMRDGGWRMCVVPLDEVEAKVDASWWQPLGMKSSRSYKIDLTGIEISEKDFIGKAGDYYREPYFSGGAIRFAAVQLGGVSALFDKTREYLQKLKYTDDPYQKMRLGEMAIRIESGNLWLASAAEKLQEYEQNPTAERSEKFLAYANMTRTAIEQICQDTMLFCERSIGARGLNKPFHFERIIRDLTIYLRQPAPDAALADVGKYVLESNLSADDLWRK
ncbi:MAG: acyl-CoA dehydrogenase family protein [Pyrinomonadaceae bacterium]